jgi:hypothetical protein
MYYNLIDLCIPCNREVHLINLLPVVDILLMNRLAKEQVSLAVQSLRRFEIQSF